jgi:D-glycero-beta-D-manno-heptose-7-phosphate kinase
MAQKKQVIESKHWDAVRLKTLLSAMNGKKVLVIGDVGVDRYTQGSVERISPEAPVPILLVEAEKHKLGLASNVADNIRTLGGIPVLCGVVGKDATAAQFRELLKEAEISDEYLVTDSTRRTVLKERVVTEKQQLLRVDYETLKPMSDEIRLEVLKKVSACISSIDAVILQDYSKGLIEAKFGQDVIAISKRAGKPVFVDPNSKGVLQTYLGASVVTPNKKEAEALTGISIRDDASLFKAGTLLLDTVGGPSIVITLGKDGMAIFSKDSPIVEQIPTCAREVFDVSGAGDTVISVLALVQCAGGSLIEGAVLGNIAAGVEVGKRGTATVTVAEIIDAMNLFLVKSY